MVPDHGHSRPEIAERLAAQFRPSHVRDMVYGGIDGAVTTFAIVAGVVGASLAAEIAVIMGFANLLADGFSMAAANYSGTKADRDNQALIRAVEHRHIELYPEGEREEVRQILAAKGIEGPALEAAVAAVTADRERWVDLMLTDEYGLPSATADPRAAAIWTFVAFALCGAVPLVPYLLSLDRPFALATVLTAAVFFAIGAAKSCWSVASWWRSGIETLSIGAIAAAVAFGVGFGLARLFGSG